MKFGVCGEGDVVSAAAAASYDYAELSVPKLFKPAESDDVFDASLQSLLSAGLRYEAANGFIPGELKIVGSEVDTPALQKWVSVAMARAEKAGVEIVVFGSGGARRIPDGFDRDAAWAQIVDFCGWVGPMAERHGVTVVVEPLNLKECNVLNTVGEGAKLVSDVGHSAVRLLVDAYHLMRDRDSYEDIVKYGDLIKHTHIATEANRLPPGAEPCDFAPFFKALSDIGYDGRISIEGGIKDPANQLPKALEVMKAAAVSAA